jgi:hypothetical protein
MIDKIKNMLYSKPEVKRDTILLQREELGANFCETCGRGPLQQYSSKRRSFVVLKEGKVLCLVCSQEKDMKEYEDVYIPGC